MPLNALLRGDDQVQLSTTIASPSPSHQTGRLSPTSISAAALHDLQPMAMVPERLSAGASPSGVLENVQRVEINETRVHDGETFFVLDVFLHHFDTRLPVNLSYLRRAALANPSAVTGAGVTPIKGWKPDYQVERRFTDFCDLRRQVYQVVCMNPHVRCASCDEVIMYVRFKLRQPRPVMHLLTAGCTSARKEILATFVNEFLRMARSKERQNRKCESHGLVELFLEAFLRKPQEDTESSFSSSRRSW